MRYRNSEALRCLTVVKFRYKETGSGYPWKLGQFPFYKKKPFKIHPKWYKMYILSFTKERPGFSLFYIELDIFKWYVFVRLNFFIHSNVGYLKGRKRC